MGSGKTAEQVGLGREGGGVQVGEDGWLNVSGGAKVGAGENEGRQACGVGVWFKKRKTNKQKTPSKASPGICLNSRVEFMIII